MFDICDVAGVRLCCKKWVISETHHWGVEPYWGQGVSTLPLYVSLAGVPGLTPA